MLTLLPSQKDVHRIRKIVFAQPQDAMATSILLIGLPLGYAIQLAYILPSYEQSWLPILVGLLGLNLYASWAMMMRVGPNGTGSPLPQRGVQQGWRFCHDCQLQVPPRAYHCPVCDRCALRRDHHCSFGGVCVGHHNQRYFISTATSLWLAQLLCIPATWHWLIGMLNGAPTLFSVWQLFLPHVALVFRLISVWQFCAIATWGCLCAATVFTTYLILAQLFCLSRGQTRMEYLLDVHAYALPWKETARLWLGERWYLAAFFPFVPSNLPTDGTAFPTRTIATHGYSAKAM